MFGSNRPSSTGSILALDVFLPVLVNRRTRTPTLCGWSLVALVIFLIINYILSKRASQQTISVDSLDKLPILGFRQNPKYANPLPVDPQEEEFKKIEAENMEGVKPLAFPVFDPNLERGPPHGQQQEQQQRQQQQQQQQQLPSADDIIQEVVLPHNQPEVARAHPKAYPVQLLFSPDLLCDSDEALLLVVFSQPLNRAFRNAIRFTWGRYDPSKYDNSQVKIKWKTIFVMGKTGAGSDEELKKEAYKHKDMIVGNFQDNKFEDTLKFMVSLTWLTESLPSQCGSVRYVIKTSDIVYHNMVVITEWLTSRYPEHLQSRSHMYVGKLLRKDRPIRDPADPLFVSKTDYPRDIFPDLIQGPVYALSYYTVISLTEEMLSASVTPIAMEDAYVGILAEQLRVRPQHDDHFQMLGKTQNVCHYLRVFFVFNIQPVDHLEIFKRIKKARQSQECLNAQPIRIDIK